METIAILTGLRELGVRLAASEGELVLTGRTDRLPPAFIAEIRSKKSLLLDLLRTDAPGADDASAIRPRTAAERAGPQALSFSQQRLWFLDQLQRESATYNLADAVRLTGRLDIGALHRTLNEVVARHEALRTVFESADGAPVQRVMSGLDLGMPIIELGDLPYEAREQRVRRMIEEEAERPFDLATGPLIRVTLVRLAAEEHVVLFTLHHIVSDGWSLGVLIREVGALYAAFLEGRPSPLPPLAIQYADFAWWQRKRLGDGALERQIGYWREQLADAPARLDLPTDYPRPAVPRYRGASHPLMVPAPLRAALQLLSQQAGATLFMTLDAAYATLLARTTGQHDLCIGTPVANRSRPELEPLIGCFVNTLVLRTRVDTREPFTGLLARVRATALHAFANQDVPFETLVETVQPERHASHAPLAQTMLVLQNLPVSDLHLPGLELRAMPAERSVARYDLALKLTDTGTLLAGEIEYDADLFAPQTIARMAARFLHLLEAIAAKPETRVGDLPLLDEATRHQVLVEWNATDLAAPGWASVQQALEELAARQPDHPAVICDGAALSYAGLNARANRLAHALIRAGAGLDVRIGLIAERSAGAIVGMLAILKAGAAYVPLDPNYPQARLAHMLADSAPALLVAPRMLWERLPPHDVPVLDLDPADGSEAGVDDLNPSARALPDHLAYVVYTSGSTGTPKGVAVTQGNLAASIAARLAFYAPFERHLLTLSLSFDSALAGIFGTLLSGGTLIVPDETDARDVEAISLLLARHKVDTLICTASLYADLIGVLDRDAMRSLTQIIVGGEPCPPSVVGLTRLHAPGARLTNEYGPTEATIWATAHEITDDAGGGAIPIGRPVGNARVYLLDEALRPVPPGIAGELYIGGQGIARGYLGRPDLTAERFVPDPFGPQLGARLYRTGDLARHRHDGTLSFLGRADSQIKLRGFRIEPGEIETALLRLDGVTQAAVVVQGDGTAGQYLAAFIAPAALDGEALRAALMRTMPEHMVPASIVVMDALPLTANGKIDRRALPQAGPTSPGIRRTPPRTATETALASLWRDVLGVDEIGVEDNFFALGGHSLLATQLMTRMRAHFGIDLPLRALFEAPTIATFAPRLPRASETAAAGECPEFTIAPVPRDTAPPLSFAQQRLWFIDQLQPGHAFYNIPAALRLTGPLDESALGRALNEIRRRHEVLRTSFANIDGAPRQTIVPYLEEPLRVIDLREMPGDEREAHASGWIAAEARAPFDLAEWPLLRVALLRLDEREHIIVFTLHHIVADGWSMGVFARELSALYDAYLRGERSPLPEPAVQYADFAHWQREWLSGERLAAQTRYWTRALAGAPPLLPLPTDRPRPAIQRHDGATLEFTVPASVASRLRSIGNAAGATLFMTLTAAFNILLARHSGQTDLSVGTPIANRRHAHTEDLIGFFVNTLVLRNRLAGNPSFRAFLSQVRDTTLDAYAHQDLPFESLVELLKPERETSYAPLVQVLIVLQNAPLGDLRLPGLAVEALDAGNPIAKFDLSLYFSEAGGALSGIIEYSAALFDASTIQRMAGHMRNLLAAIAANPDGRIHDLPMLGAAERAAILEGFNDTAISPERPLPALHAGFEAQVWRTPDAIALVCGEARLTYAGLNARANRLAWFLREQGVRPDTLVGLCTRRSVETVVGLLAILKAGGTYMPLDPSYPQDRLATMLADAAPALLLTQQSLAANPAFAATARFLLDADWHALAGYPAHDPALVTQPTHLSHVIYTSGSTGRPKGTAIQHSSSAAFIDWALRAFDAESLARVLASTSVCFDLSIFEIFAPLSCGGSVWLVEDILALAVDPQRYPVTLINTVPSAIAELDRQNAIPPSAAVINLAGEALQSALVQALYRRPTVERVYNLYGPTEDTTYSTYALMRRDGQGACPIGWPVDNTQVYLLDAGGEPVPVGVAGELYLGGAGLARGYIDRPRETAERFVPNPFAAEPGARMYRTGDLARYLPDGCIEYLGRLDNQIKLRGFRIELGEVEAALASLAVVRDAAVLAREDRPGDRQLVAYVVPQAEGRGEDAAHLELQLAQWSAIFDELYADGAPREGEDDTFNIAGWTDSYRHAPIPAVEMREWVGSTVARILALKPANVLELGVGTGLLLHRIAPHCRRYTGTDFSQPVIEQLGASVARRAYPGCRIALEARPANALDGLAHAPFDTVIVNSVAQYFPNAAYLRDVIARAIAATAGPAAIFIGDVRHFGLIEAFHASIELFHAAPSMQQAQLCRAVTQNARGENELLVDPAWFFVLKKHFPQIRDVRAVPKIGAANELNRFRYDVIITISGEGPAEADARLAPAWQEWGALCGLGAPAEASLAALDARLAALPEAGLALRDIPDAAIAYEVHVAEALHDARANATVQQLADEYASRPRRGIDPAALAALCERHGLHVAFAAGTGASGRFHAYISREPAAIDWSGLYLDPRQPLDPMALVNQPAAARRQVAIRNDIRHRLQQMLPDYMVPARFVMLERMPLNANGKIDRKALPAPDWTHDESRAAPPRTPTEQVLAQIWSDVLQVERPGIHDNFFELGGHSLLATRIVSHVREAFGIELSLRALFEAPTLAELAQRVEAGRHDRAGLVVPPVTPAERDGRAPLSFAQQRLWVLSQFDGTSGFYNIPVALRLTGRLDVPVLRRTLDETVSRHEILRTRFVAEAGEPMQVIDPAGPLDVPVIDLTAHPEAEREARRLADAEARRPFDLAADHPIRVTLIRMGEGAFVILFTLHHIASDGWSTGVLIGEIAAIYAAFADGAPSPLAELPIQYADFALWQRRWLAGDALERQTAYWLEQLDPAPALLALPTDFPRPSVQRYRGAQVMLEAPAETTAKLNAIARQHQATLFMVLAAAFDILLARYSGQTDIAIGTGIAGRTRSEIEPLIGFFVNTLVLRTTVEEAEPFPDLLARVRATTLNAYANQDVPFERLVELTRPERHLSHAPLVQATLALQNTPQRELTLPDVTLDYFAAEQATSKFDLSMHLAESGDRLTGMIEYDTDLFAPATIERMARHFVQLLAAIAETPEARIADLAMLSEAERAGVLRGGSDTTSPRIEPRTVHTRIEAQAARTPDRPAVQCGDVSLSYAGLNDRASRLAHRLRAHGAGPEAVIGLCLPRSPELIVAMLAVLKAGAAYLPLDPDYPPERLAFMLEDSGCPLVITQGALAGVLPDGPATLDLDEEADAGPAGDPDGDATPQNLAYVIYTSGSTGRPKGVLLHHDGLCNLIDAQARVFGLTPRARVLQFASFNFDAATWEIVMALSAGATLCLAPREDLLPGRDLEATLQRLAIDTATLPPVGLATLDPDALPELRTIIVAGEACPGALVRDWQPGRRFFNAYGPTETTVCATIHPCEAGSETAPPIGRPLLNTGVYVLDSALNPVPPGATGALYVAGDGLARGYLNRPDLTAAAFLPDPFSPIPGARMYRTGDLARMLPDGTLHYAGRADHQVKLRGFRIEPGEIEAVMRALPAVADAFVMPREDMPGEKHLAAYLVPSAAAGRWEATFEDIYGAPDDAAHDDRFDITGWNSTFDNRPLPAAEMREWVERTVARIRALRPRRVLEIGCGTGLLLHRLAPDCDAYTGTDFAASVVRKLERSLHAHPPGSCDVRVLLASADALRDFGDTKFDTVIINSVAQYFTSAAYLDKVIARALELLEPGGRIFLGDIRHAGLMETFHTALRLFNAAPDTPLAEIRDAARESMRWETELLIDPAYLHGLPARFPRIARVELQAKDGDACNELTRFRYDAVLTAAGGGGEAPPLAPDWLRWEDVGDIGAVARLLASLAQDVVAIRDVPDARIADAVYAARRVRDASSGETVADLRRQDAAGVDHRILAEQAAEHGYSLHLSPASGDAGTVHAVFTRHPLRIDWSACYAQALTTTAISQPYIPPASANLAETVLDALRARLPDYMVPAHVVTLERLPLNANGKIDRAALPKPGRAATTSGESVRIGPRTDAERMLHQLWLDVLALDDIGIHDNFFTLGGHSMTAVKLMARIASRFQVELPLSQLFLTPTVATLGEAIARHTPQRGLLVPMRPHGEAAPLFFIHPAGGEVFSYLKLAEMIAPAHPIYGIQSPAAAGIAIEPYTLDAVCAAYIAEMRQVQPSGPYHLLGHSLGGMLSFHVAQLLERAGETVAWVAMLDATRVEQEDSVEETFSLPSIIAGLLDERDEDFAAQYGADAVGALQMARARVAEIGLAPFCASLASPGDAGAADVDPELLQRLLKFHRDRSLAGRFSDQFRPTPLRAPVHAFWAEHTLRAGADPQAWKSLSAQPGSCLVLTLPGGHNEFVTGDNAGPIAAALGALLASPGVATSASGDAG